MLSFFEWCLKGLGIFWHGKPSARRLRELEGEAVRLGIPDRELHDLRSVGSCDAQVRYRMAQLEDWIKNHHPVVPAVPPAEVVFTGEPQHEGELIEV